MAGLSALTGMEIAEMRRRWWTREGEWAAEEGFYATAEDYHSAFTAALGVLVPVAEWVANRRSAMTPLPDSIAASERAAELGAVSLLTNNNALLGAHLPVVAHELVPAFGPDHLRASAYYRARKPGRAVFDRLLASYAADPADVFFTDDREDNDRGAEETGITGHVYRDATGLLAAIEDFAARRGRV